MALAESSIGRTQPRRIAPRQRRRVRLVSDLGLFLLPGLWVETITGLFLFVFGVGLIPKYGPVSTWLFRTLSDHHLLWLQDIGFQVDLHVWAGYITTGALAAKIWASWPTLTGWRPREFSTRRLTFEKCAAWAVLILTPMSYLTGLALQFHWISLRERLVFDAHLWLSIVLIFALAWHVWRFLPVGLKAFWVQVQRGFG